MNFSLLRGVCSTLLPALSLIIGSATAVGAPTNATGQQDVARPSPRTLEARLSWGVGASRADKAYRLGATGAGVIVAMIDTGLPPSSAPLFSHVSPDSIDLVPDRTADFGNRLHGEQTASLLAGRVDGAGTFGIAYGATLLSIRADRDGSCLKICAFDPKVLARAVDYAVDHGAAVVGLPLASHHSIPELEPALQRAVTKGVVIVAAAGNDGSDQPVWPARYAADPRFSRSMLVAGATTHRGKLAAWSNKAGAVQDRFVGAPGDQVVVDCGDRRCYLASGTSYSVSYAAGAVALLLSRDRALSGPGAAALLLGNTVDLGARGPDPLTGRGRLDVKQALNAMAGRASG